MRPNLPAVRRLTRLAVAAALIGIAAVLRDRRIAESERALGLGEPRHGPGAAR
jgi:hypothetical protein